MANPFEQFEIKKIIDIPVAGVDASFTNSAAFMVITVAVVTLFLTMSMRGRALVPGRWQLTAELCYEFVGSMVRDNVGAEGRKYFPFIFTLFTAICVSTRGNAD